MIKDREMPLQDHGTNVHYLSPITAMEGATLVKKVSVDYKELSSVLAYDAENGTFTWRVRTSPKASAGAFAGNWLMAANGKKYLSITYKGRKMMASQVAWCLYHKEWPERSVHFIDEDSENLRITNLKKADYLSLRIVDDKGITRYRMHKDQVRYYGLARYGVTMTQYSQMFAAQNGLCAICNRPETAKIPGRKTANSGTGTRDLSVDHDHETGAVRQLLCNACNHILGEAGDNPEFLRAAADYLEFHRKALKDVC